MRSAWPQFLADIAGATSKEPRLRRGSPRYQLRWFSSVGLGHPEGQRLLDRNECLHGAGRERTLVRVHLKRRSSRKEPRCGKRIGYQGVCGKYFVRCAVETL